MANNSTDLVAAMAERFQMMPDAFTRTCKSICFPDGKATDEQFFAFLVIAKGHDLNPFTREIYAFPRPHSGIQAIVSIDGWLKIINSHPQFDGMEFEDKVEGGKLLAITCRIYRKDRKHPVECTEYMRECARQTEPWQKWPGRMLRHKAAIQTARYAFGFAGIIDPDESQRYETIVDVTELAPDERPRAAQTSGAHGTQGEPAAAKPSDHASETRPAPIKAQPERAAAAPPPQGEAVEMVDRKSTGPASGAPRLVLTPDNAIVDPGTQAIPEPEDTVFEEVQQDDRLLTMEEGAEMLQTAISLGLSMGMVRRLLVPFAAETPEDLKQSQVSGFTKAMQQEALRLKAARK